MLTQQHSQVADPATDPRVCSVR